MFTIIPDLFSPYKYTTQKIIHSLEAPSSSYLLGTDQFGRDILSRIIYGTRTVIFVTLTSIIVALIFGIPIGLIAGYYSGIIDSLFMRFQDAILSFPVLLQRTFDFNFSPYLKCNYSNIICVYTTISKTNKRYCT